MRIKDYTTYACWTNFENQKTLCLKFSNSVKMKTTKTNILKCKFILAGRKHLDRCKQAFSTRWKFSYLEFSTCSTCPHQKKSYVVVRIIDLLMTLMTSVRGVHYIRTVTPILGHGSVKVSSFWCKWPPAPGGDTLYLLCPKRWYSPNQ